jgi:hypothetical protein
MCDKEESKSKCKCKDKILNKINNIIDKLKTVFNKGEV